MGARADLTKRATARPPVPSKLAPVIAAMSNAGVFFFVVDGAGGIAGGAVAIGGEVAVGGEVAYAVGANAAA